MARRLPSLNALRAFEAAARHLSLTKAAGELNVTPGALSHQIKALEARLGAKLFQRTARGLAFTDVGRDYLPVVRDAFDRLAAGTDSLFGPSQAATLTVSVSHASPPPIPRSISASRPRPSMSISPPATSTSRCATATANGPASPSPSSPTSR